MLRYILPILLIVSVLWPEQALPRLNPLKTREKAKEILRSHVKHQFFDEEVAKKTYLAYLDRLDPLKMYFTKTEIVKWTDPSPALCRETVTAFQKGNYQEYGTMLTLFQKAIQRRNRFEEMIDDEKLPENVSYKEFKDITWSEDENELMTRIAKVRSLQLSSAKKLEKEDADRALEMQKKYRLRREQKFVFTNSKEESIAVQSYFLKALANALDHHTEYFTPKEASDFLRLVQQKFVGIGAMLRDDMNGFTLTQLIEGGPAQKGGILKSGDKIIAVNNEPVIGLDCHECVERIQGPKGTPVTLTILREHKGAEKEAEKFTIKVIREEIILKEGRLEAKTHPCGPGVIAHFDLHTFYTDEGSSSSQDIYNEFQKIAQKERIVGVILDLRNNGGGPMNEAVNVCSLFMKKGVVCSAKDNSGAVKHYRNLANNKIWDGPLLVLTNIWSASSSEIVAQTLQDYGRALLVGDPYTYGKGSYQMFSIGRAKNGIDPEGEYKVTGGLYFTVSGRSPQLQGAKADIPIPGEYSELDIGESFTKRPLESEEIANNFHDSLSDIHPFHRQTVLQKYGNDVQEKEYRYTQYLQKLQANSKKRLQDNENYQALLEVIKQDDYDVDKVDEIGKNDLQLEESLHIMKDLISLSSP